MISSYLIVFVSTNHRSVLEEISSPMCACNFIFSEDLEVEISGIL